MANHKAFLRKSREVLKSLGPKDLNFTGDGYAATYTGASHSERAYLTALRLYDLLDELGYVQDAKRRTERHEYGIGVETGILFKLGDGEWIGDPINIAARLQGLTRMFARTPIMVGENTFQALARGINPSAPCFHELEFDEGETEGTAWDQFDELMKPLGLLYVGRLFLKGVVRPRMVYRLSPYRYQQAHELKRRLRTPTTESSDEPAPEGAANFDERGEV